MAGEKAAIEYQKKLGKLEKELLQLKKEGEFGSTKKSFLEGYVKGHHFYRKGD